MPSGDSVGRIGPAELAATKFVSWSRPVPSAFAVKIWRSPNGPFPLQRSKTILEPSLATSTDSGPAMNGLQFTTRTFVPSAFAR